MPSSSSSSSSSSLAAMILALFLLLAPASSASASAASPDPLLLPQANAADLVAGRADRVVAAAFVGDDAPGAMLVRGVPGYAAARVEALRVLARCATADDAPMRRAAGWDETHGGRGAFTRATVAARSSARLPSALDARCGDATIDALESLRRAADAAAAAALPRLDAVLGYDTGGFFRAAVDSESSLDHFHVFTANDRSAPDAGDEEEASFFSAAAAAAAATEEDASAADPPPPEDPSAPPGLRGKGEHTDVGIAIVMTPALMVSPELELESESESDARGARGLKIGGRSPELPPDAIVVMLGEAARAWLPLPPPGGEDASSPSNSPLAVPTHEMSLDGGAASSPGTSRAWFGRMILPPPDAKHPTATSGDGAPLTFGEWHENAAEAFGGDDDDDDYGRGVLAAAACAPLPHHDDGALTSITRRRRLQDDSGCAAGKVYCWLTCVDEPAGGCASPEVAKCVSGAGLVWPDQTGEGHCYDCKTQCVASDYGKGNDGGGSGEICNSKIAGTSMYMDGFLGWGNEDGPCVIFLEKNLKLSTVGELFAAFFVTIAIGVAVEALAAARRKRQKTAKSALERAKAKAERWGESGDAAARRAAASVKAQSLAMYAVQVTCGYLLMLISMTYHAVLFAGVVLGLILGHALFNLSVPVGAATGGASACCAHVGTVPGGSDGGDGAAEDAPSERGSDGGGSDGCGDAMTRPMMRGFPGSAEYPTSVVDITPVVASASPAVASLPPLPGPRRSPKNPFR
jgi:hypothetical protein